jgi:uncharacterized repeat protein (TIGR01451 family)
VCLNDGNGSSFTCHDVDTNTASLAVAAGDLDGQNGPDLVFSKYEQPNRVCLNDGSANFSCSDISADLNRSFGVALADLDGQNGQDIVFANWSAQRNRMCLNDGSANFTCGDVSADEHHSWAVAIGDVDGQNGPDLVFAHFIDFFSPDQLCLNDGTGAFTCGDLGTEIEHHAAVAIGDVDGQNGPDVVFTRNNNNQTNRLCLNNGTGTFTCGDFNAETGSQKVAIGDVDGQNGPDVVFENDGPDRVCLNDGSGSFTCSDVSPDTGVSRGVALGALRTTDLWITKTDGQTTAIPGGALTYTVTAGNAGPIDAFGASVSDVVPPELSCTWVCAASGGATCTPGPVAGDLADSVDLPAGSMVEYLGACTIDPGATGSLVNRATVTTPFEVSERYPEDNEATDIDLLDPQADLAITKTDRQTTAVPGGELTYIITAYNAGPIGVTGASVSDFFPPELSCTWVCTGSGGATCTPGPVAGDLSDTVDLPVDGTASYAVSCVIDPGATGLLINTASVTTPAGVSDPNAANDSATDSDLLTPRADLAITKDNGTSTVAPGGATTYTIVAANPLGPSDAPGSTVTDVFPSSLSCTWTCIGSGGAGCTPGPVAGDLVDTAHLPLGGAATYSAVCDVDPEASGTLTNTATVAAAAGVTDPDPGNDSATDEDAITPVDPLIFADGFESGDVSAWSAAVP